MSLPVISVAQMRQWEESTWQKSITESEVMGKAGQAVATLALSATESGARILLLAGKGHNGDDTRLAQGHLRERKTHLLNLVDPAKQIADLRIELE